MPEQTESQQSTEDCVTPAQLYVPDIADVLAAAERITPYVHRTPVLRSSTMDKALGAQLFFKCENFQRMGAFKFRGAMNALLTLSDQQRRAGVVCYSSGNHGQALAMAGSLLSVAVTVVMPADAPQAKITATAGYGARIVLFDRHTEDRMQLCETLVAEQGLSLIPPYDHPDVISGQGTAALELLQETGPLDALLVCLGGGGLLAGSLLAARQFAPHCRTFGVEPEAANDAQQSLRAGRIIRIDVPTTIADGAQTQSLGQYTFPIIARDVADIVTVSDDMLIASMRFYAERMKMIVEPTGCLSLAGAQLLKEQLQGQRVGVIVSGGNVDLSRLGAYFA